MLDELSLKYCNWSSIFCLMSLSCVLSSFNLQNLFIYFHNIGRNETPAECRRLQVPDFHLTFGDVFPSWKILWRMENLGGWWTSVVQWCTTWSSLTVSRDFWACQRIRLTSAGALMRVTSLFWEVYWTNSYFHNSDFHNSTLKRECSKLCDEQLLELIKNFWGVWLGGGGEVRRLK